MYYTQIALVLVLLVFTITSVFYNTIDLKTSEIKNEIEVKMISLAEKNIEHTINHNLDKIVNDVFINVSYTLMKEHRFFNNSSSAEECIENNITYILNKTLYNVCRDNFTIIVSHIRINPTSEPTRILLTGEVLLKYRKELENNVSIIINKEIGIIKEITLKEIPDPYVYNNKFYYNWSYCSPVDVNVSNGHHIFKIILNNTNFNYTLMKNPNDPSEIRIIGSSKIANEYILLPYWIEKWRYNNISVIWVNCSEDNLINGKIFILYNSSTKINRENPHKTFILFDNFNYLDNNSWEITGGCWINNGLLYVKGPYSKLSTKRSFSYNYELIFRANFSSVMKLDSENISEFIGFFKNDSNGIGFIYYNTSWGKEGLYVRYGQNLSKIPNFSKYLNNFYIYSVSWGEDRVSFRIYNEYYNLLYNKSINININENYPISICTEGVLNATVLVDWLVLKDVSNIIAIPQKPMRNILDYHEEKPKTYKGTIYYGDPEQYIKVNDGRYSIIGMFTNATYKWGSCGYKPKIEIE
ncbi:hypothetical protein J422_01920 [Methanocaldococcus villosus KIN24-T80]|uniref:DUF2341 domain-containing protein n=1 Tax=Methanocaldococcus villosus KIN24-T80 TaxID=1069083 RepID=N6VTN5_9EURY|nr:DUF2341 domain-containing protein [Methanocaldococcus villosus]ENN96531.1 hypothetical protein J422_01920 [Methanocaldococcus villosus KIN24-T80]